MVDNLYHIELRDRYSIFCKGGAVYTISIANQKGGSGKTTTAVNLAACLEDKGRKVLLVDLDPQGQSSTWLRAEELNSTGSVFDTLLETRATGMPLADLGLKITDNLTLLQSESISVDDEARLADQPKRFSRLSETLDKMKDEYDFAVIDCPPTLGVLTRNALFASDAVILAIETSFLALHGVGRMLELVKEIQKKHPIKVFALATMFDRRTNFAQEVLDNIGEYFEEMMFKSVIRQNVRLKEAASSGEPIIKYDPRSHGAEDYTALTNELLKRIF